MQNKLYLHRLLVNLDTNLFGDRLERANGVADDLQLVVLAGEHFILHRQYAPVVLKVTRAAEGDNTLIR